MQQLQISARFKIHDGKTAEFRSLADQCVARVQEKDTQTRQYDWFFSADGTACEVRETYDNSEALLEHMGNVGDLLGPLFAIADLEVAVYGTPSEELIAATAEIPTVVYDFYKGI